MKKPVHTAVFLLMLQCCFLHAQTPDPLSFFPHHQGDIWEYVDPFIPGPYEQNRITSDSLLPDGRFMVQTNLFGKNIIDTSAFTVSRTFNNVDTLLQYRLDAQEGQRWVQYRYSGATFLATVVDVFETLVFGHLVTVKQIDYTDSASSLLFDTDYLASGFGLIGQDADGFPYRRLRGAIINGVQYGTATVSVPDFRSNLPTTVVLHQNYPNPFNPSTTFKFDLPEPATVSLVVYDLLGRQIAEVISGRFEAGYHSRTWNARLRSSNTGGQASDVASGVYLARFTATGETGEIKYSRTTKLILMK